MQVFDIESNGLLKEISVIHCIHIGDTETGIIDRYDTTRVPLAIQRLQEADCIVGHNIIGYDIPAIKKVFPKFNPKGSVIDTMLFAQLAFGDIGTSDLGRIQRGDFPARLRGRHSLEAYGYRLGEHKGDYTGGWAMWNQEMSDYCEQDVRVTMKLLQRCQGVPGVSQESMWLEMDVAFITRRQEINGFSFNVPLAVKLYALLCKRREDLKGQLHEVFPPFYTRDGKDFIPKKDNKPRKYTAGCAITKIKLVEFNPASHAHIIRCLKVLYNWTPIEFTDNGTPKMDDEVMSSLVYPEAKFLAEYMMIQKRIGQIAEGDNSWLNMVQEDGRIHGRVNTLGAVTRRMTHTTPNVAQVPSLKNGKGHVPYGAECRELFGPRRGWVQVGGDASGLELRCLAHYMGRWDNGDYAKVILQGDVHTTNQQAAKLPTRDAAKRFIYAFLYGAGAFLLGQLVTLGDGATYTEAQLRKIGKKVRDQFMAGLPALLELEKAVKAKAKANKYILSLDGSRLPSRSEHSALNLLLQSCGAIIMKKALVILDKDILQGELGLRPGIDYEFMANIHDEFQLECPPELAETVGKAIVESITRAGLHFSFRCPLDGEHKVGNNWKECH